MSDPEASDAIAPTLVVTGGAFDGRSLRLEPAGRAVLGSGPHSSLRLHTSNVDSEHAGLVWEPQGVLLSDLGSASGTYVNGERVPPGAEHMLQDGDRVFLGPPISPDSVRLVVHIPEAALSGEAFAPAAAEGEALLFEAEGEPLALSQGEADETAAVPEPEAAPSLEPEPEAEPELLAEPEPETPSPPEPMAPPPPITPAPPAVVPAAPAPAKPAPRPQYYTDDVPSIGGDRVREPLDLPPQEPAPVPKPAARKGVGGKAAGARLSFDAIPRPVLVGVAALAVVSLVGYAGYRLLHHEPPVMTSVLPPKAEASQTVTIAGSGFATSPAGNVVRFGELTATVTSASATQLAVSVPAVKVAAGVVDVRVTVETRGVRSNALFFKVSAPPKVASLEPEVAMAGDELVASGQNLVGQGLTVSIERKPAELIEVTPTALRVRVPNLDAVQGQAVPVVVQVGPESSKPVNLLVGRLPLLLEARPNRGLAGTRVTLEGRGFAPRPEDNRVAFSSATAVVFSASPHLLVVSVPGVAALQPQVPLGVVVTTQGRASTQPLVFTLERPGTTSYVPRFFAAPLGEHAGHEHAFVSNELGPVLLLTGKADAPSLAERAERAADTLNRAFADAAAGQARSFEARDQPAPAVGVAGDPLPVATVTAADAAAYSESWDGKPARRASAQAAVATYWAALLQDQLALFAQRQRPARLLELTPRGRVLTEMFAEAQRTAGPGAGVPIEQAGRLPPATLAALRDLALQLPEAGSPGGAAAAIEGRWAGTIVEGDAGERPIEVVFRLEGGVLTGSATSRAGGVAMNVPMREARYEKGSLRFVLVARGAPKYFVGTLAGETISGTIHESATARESVGRFTLSFIQ